MSDFQNLFFSRKLIKIVIWINIGCAIAHPAHPLPPPLYLLLDFYYKYCSIKRTGLTCFKKFLLSVPYKSNKCPGFLSVLVSIKRTGFGDHSYHSFIDKSFTKSSPEKAFQGSFTKSFPEKLSRNTFGEALQRSFPRKLYKSFPEKLSRNIFRGKTKFSIRAGRKIDNFKQLYAWGKLKVYWFSINHTGFRFFFSLDS